MKPQKAEPSIKQMISEKKRQQLSNRILRVLALSRRSINTIKASDFPSKCKIDELRRTAEIDRAREIKSHLTPGKTRRRRRGGNRRSGRRRRRGAGAIVAGRVVRHRNQKLPVSISVSVSHYDKLTIAHRRTSAEPHRRSRRRSQSHRPLLFPTTSFLLISISQYRLS